MTAGTICVETLDRVVNVMLGHMPFAGYQECPLNVLINPGVTAEGSAIIEPRSDLFGEKVRYGYEKSWDGVTPHSELPIEVLIRRPPTGLFVLGSSTFDFIFNSSSLSNQWQANRATVGAVASNSPLVEEVEPSPHDAVWLYLAWSDGVDPQRYSIDQDQADVNRSMLNALIQNPKSAARIRWFQITASGTMVGMQLAWMQPETKTWFTPYRYLLPEHRNLSRFLMGKVAEIANREGILHIDDGDCIGGKGVFRFKRDLQPERIQHYAHALSKNPYERHER